MKRILLAAFAASFVASAAEAAQQQDFSQATVKVTDLGSRTYMLENWNMNAQTGGNMVAAIGTDGVILVDGNFAPMHDKIKAAITTMSDQPIRFLVNTHFHGDHTGGNAPFAMQEMVTIVAHENLKRRLESGTTNGLTGARTEPAAPAAVPKQTYADRTTVQVGGRTAQVAHPNGAHTDTDSYVYFADANVLATGDIVTFGRYPNIDFANGGHIDGMIAAVDAYIALTNDNSKVVPGHGPLGNRAMLREYKDMLTSARARVARLIAEGKTIDEAVAAKPNADYDMRYNMNEMQAGNFVRVIYRSLKPA
jgi:glyoxylase-like metal-dependent hydrolase (beta-lactamase superfamily II)